MHIPGSPEKRALSLPPHQAEGVEVLEVYEAVKGCQVPSRV